MLDLVPKSFDEYVSAMTDRWQRSPVSTAIWVNQDVCDALILMEDAHEGVFRKLNGRPYSTHPRRVAMFSSMRMPSSSRRFF